MSDPVPAPAPLLLRVKDASGVREVLLSGRARYDLGRDATCAVPLADSKCSRRHLELVTDGDGCEIVDLGSRNGVTLNGKKVEQARVRPGDVIRLGLSEVTVVALPAATAAPAPKPEPAAAVQAPAPAPVPPPGPPAAGQIHSPESSQAVPILSTALPAREVDCVSAAAGPVAGDPEAVTLADAPDPRTTDRQTPRFQPAGARRFALGVVALAVVILAGVALVEILQRAQGGGSARTGTSSPMAGASGAASASPARAATGDPFPREWEEREARAADADDLLAFYLAEEARLRGTPLAPRAAARAAWLRRLRATDAPRRIAALTAAVQPLLDAGEFARAADLARALEADLGAEPPAEDLIGLRDEIARRATADLERVRDEVEALKKQDRPVAALARLERDYGRFRGVVPRDALAALRSELDVVLAATSGAAPAAGRVPGAAEVPGPVEVPGPAAAAVPAVPAAAAAVRPLPVNADTVAQVLAAAEPAWHAYRYAEVRAALVALRDKAGDKPPAELVAALADLDEEVALFQRLLARIADPAAPPLDFVFDDQLKGHVVKADATRFEAEGALAAGGSGKVTVARTWAELPPVQLYHRFLGALGLGGEAALPVAVFLWNHHLEGEAMTVLLRVRRAGPNAATAVDAFLARRLHVAVPAGGFVEAEGRLLTPEERDAIAKKKADDREKARAAEEAVKKAATADQAARLFALGQNARKEGNFALARQLWATLAARYPTSTEGKTAKDLLAEPALGLVPLVENGPAANRFDLLITGDGYTFDQQDELLKQAHRIAEQLFRAEPFKEYAAYFNVYAVGLESKESGFTIVPGSTVKDTALAGRMANDLMEVDHARVRRCLHDLPNDGLVIVLINGGGTSGTGGAGVLAMGASASMILHHEIGHALAGLGDEYETKVGAAALGPASQAKRNRPGFENVNGEWVRVREVPPRALAPNLMEGSNLAAMAVACPWRHWLEHGQDNWRASGQQKVGFFEGAGMQTHDVWRPQRDCRMRTATEEYCVVCMEQMVLAFHEHVRGIDAWEPREDQVKVAATRPYHFQVRTLAPLTHSLKVDWSVKTVDLRAGARPAGETQAADAPGRPLAGGIARGADGKQVFFCDIQAGALAPGTYDLTAHSLDPTPYVLADPEKRLQATRTWRIEVE